MLTTTTESIPLSVEYILSLTSHLDTNGISSLDYRLLALATGVILVLIRHFAGEKGGIEWHSFLHAIITGVGAAMCIHLNSYAAEITGGPPEPLRTLNCAGPLTSLHKILPSITLGYSITDIINGFSLGKIDFIFHGFLTSFGALLACTQDIHYNAAEFLVMEISTIFLTMIKVEIFGEAGQVFLMGMFALSFIIVRNIIAPYRWASFLWVYYQEYNMKGDVCFSMNKLYAVTIIGAFFHLLNLFWMYKIIKKIQRKLSGNERKSDAKLE